MEYILYTTALFATVVLFVIYIYMREQQFKEERQDMLERIMSKDIEEYKEVTSEPIKYDPVTVTEEIEYLMELEEQKR